MNKCQGGRTHSLVGSTKNKNARRARPAGQHTEGKKRRQPPKGTVTFGTWRSCLFMLDANKPAAVPSFLTLIFSSYFFCLIQRNKCFPTPLPHPKLHMYSSLTPFLAPGGRMSLHRPTSLVTHIQKMETVSITKPPWTRFDDEPSVAGNPALDHINLHWANDLKGTDMRLIVVRIKAIGTFPAGFLHNPHIKNKHANNNSAPNCNQRHTFH